MILKNLISAEQNEDACLNRAFRPLFTEYFSKINQAEIARFNLKVSEWEQREYFDPF